MQFYSLYVSYKLKPKSYVNLAEKCAIKKYVKSRKLDHKYDLTKNFREGQNLQAIIVSPYFTPFAGVGVRRMHSLSKYLASNMAVTVLMFDPSTYTITTTEPVPEDVTIVTVEGDKRRLFSEIIAFHKTLKVLVAEDSTIIFSGGPFFTIFNAIWLSFTVPNKIVYDFRDDWITDTSTVLGRLKDGIKSRIIRYLARKVSLLTVVSLQMKKDYLLKYNLDEKKVAVVQNGYDDIELIYPLEKIKNEDKAYIEIGILGKWVYYSLDFSRELLKFINLNKDEVKLVHIGNKEEDLAGLLQDMNISRDIIEEKGYMDYKDALNCMLSLDVAIVINHFERGLGTKIFDYILLNKPIIYLGVVPSEMENFLNAFPGAQICRDSIDLKIALDEIKRGSISLLYDPENFDVNEFSRTKQNALFEELLRNN